MSTDPKRLAAEELLAVLPQMSSLIAVKLRQDIDTEFTLVQFQVLDQLAEHPITLTELAEQRRVTRQAASLQMQGLVERGWVRRLPDPADRRQAILELTDEGRAQLRTAHQSLNAYMVNLLEMLSDDELAAIDTVLPAFRLMITKATAMTIREPE